MKKFTEESEDNSVEIEFSGKAFSSQTNTPTSYPLGTHQLDFEVDIVIQINGKKRSIIKCKKGIKEKILINLIKNNEKIKKFVNQKKINKSIFVKDKLINLIIK